MTTSTTETEVNDSPDDILGAIGVNRRCAIHEADVKGRLLREASRKVLDQAYADLGHYITLNPAVIAILRDHKDAEFRRLLDKIEEADTADGNAHIALQYEHEKIEDKFNKLTVEFFAKYPHPVITTVDQRIAAGRANETPKGKINANR
jgi:hypothetical protein